MKTAVTPLKVLLTGANGLIGRKILQYTPYLKDLKILAASRGESRLGKSVDHITYRSLDITDQSAVNETFNSFLPDVVINTAAITQVDDCEINPVKCIKTNVDAVLFLIKLCENSGTHLIHFSTDFIFNGLDGPYREEDQPDPISVYGQSKWESEKRIINSSAKWTIIRTILVYGVPALSRPNLVTWVIERLRDNNKIKVVCDQIRTPTLADDVADGTWKILLKNATGIFHLGGNETLSPYEMALKTAKHFRLDETLIGKVQTKDFPQPGQRPLRTGLIIEKARKILDYNPRGFSEGLTIIENQLESQRQ